MIKVDAKPRDNPPLRWHK